MNINELPENVLMDEDEEWNFREKTSETETSDDESEKEEEEDSIMVDMEELKAIYGEQNLELLAQPSKVLRNTRAVFNENDMEVEELSKRIKNVMGQAA